MKYLEIELVGCKRLMLNGATQFSMKITDPLQIILGTNGSGKSSLLELLTPLPAQSSDFLKDGKKKIKIEHTLVTYTLESTFGSSQKHSFLKEDEELNPGGTVTVQKELVKQHFLITPEIHDLLLGKEAFSAMSSARRKEWFLRLCDTDYDYAIKTYNALREKHRDTLGAIKLARKKVVVESDKLINDEEKQQLLDYSAKLLDCLNILLERRKPIEYTLAQAEHDKADTAQQIYKTAKRIGSLLNQKETLSVSLEDIELRLPLLADQLTANRTLAAKYGDDVSANLQKIKILQESEERTATQLQTESDLLKAEIDSLVQRSLVKQRLENPGLLIEVLKSTEGVLIDVFSSIPDNKDKAYTQDTLSALKQQQSELVILEQVILKEIRDTELSVAHMEQHKDSPPLTCPACSHSFSLVYSESKLESLKKKISKNEERLASHVKPKIAEVKMQLEAHSEFSSKYRQYVQCTSASPKLSAYWQYLLDKEVLTKNPRSGINELSKITTDLYLQKDINLKFTTLQSNLSLIASLQSVGSLDLKSLQQGNNELEAKMNLHIFEVEKLDRERETLIASQTCILQLRSIEQKLVDLISLQRQVLTKETESLRRSILNELIRNIQSTLANTQHTLSMFDIQVRLVESLTQEIANLEKEEEAISLLLKTLSPTEGLIAEGLLGFINNFIGEMNTLIGSVWAYPLVIKSCDILEGTALDLDYKFPMQVSQAQNKVSDVSKGSSGMTEMANLAFRLTAMKYLGLQSSPVYLDEFGITLDSAHKASAVYLVKSLLDQCLFTQIFMISHDFSQYGALNNAQICVLDPTNIVIPKSASAINTHVSFH